MGATTESGGGVSRGAAEAVRLDLPLRSPGLAGEIVVDAPALLLVVRADCPTCELVLPLAGRLHRALGGRPPIAVVSQSPTADSRAVAEATQSAPLLIDDDLALSVRLAVEAVPAWYRLDADGTATRLFHGWSRKLFEELVRELAEEPPWQELELDSLPPHRPGCGSRTVEPELGLPDEPLRSRLIEVGNGVDPVEFFFDARLTDGLPIVPPTPERVLEMFTGTPLDATTVIGKVPPSFADASVEKIAVSAVMAGCRPAYLPVVIAAVEAVCEDAFDLHGVLATTYNAAPLLLVNGPVRGALGMNSTYNVLGQGNRANATIGRAVQLLVQNLGGGRPGEVDLAVHGQPGKFTYCLAEAEEESPWEPLSVERGYPTGISTVTVAGVEGPRLLGDERSRTPEQLSASLAACLATVTHPKVAGLDAVLALSPQHARIYKQAGWLKRRVKEEIWERTKRPLDWYLPDEVCGEGTPRELLEQWEDDHGKIAKLPSPDALMIIVAGAPAGAMSSIMGGWWPGPRGSSPVTKVIRT